MPEHRRHVSSLEPEHLLILCLALATALFLLGTAPGLF